MKTVISQISPSLGLTEHGSAWSLKALHPSDPMVEVHGVPDENCGASVFLNYQQQNRVSFPVTASNTWNFNGQMLGHPTQFMWYRADDGAGNFGQYTALVNQQLGPTFPVANKAWSDNFVRWRLAYAGLTVHFDGPALSNQGTISVAQIPYEPRKYYLAVNGIAGGATDKVASLRVRTPLGTSVVPGTDYPNFDTAINMPNAYTGEIRDGAYIPLRLTRTHQKWHHMSDVEFWMGANTANPLITGTLPAAGQLNDFPFPQSTIPFFSAGTVGGAAVPPLGNDIVANVSIKNMSQTAGVVLVFRYGFEVQVQPGSFYSPMQEIAVEYDPKAVEAYFLVSRRLKDAYPSDYNDLGKLWSVIKGAVRTVDDHLGWVSGPVGMISNGVRAAVDAIDSVVGPRQSKGRKAITPANAHNASAADIGDQRRRIRIANQRGSNGTVSSQRAPSTLESRAVASFARSVKKQKKKKRSTK